MHIGKLPGSAGVCLTTGCTTMSVVRCEQDIDTLGKQTKLMKANTHTGKVCLCLSVCGTLSIHAVSK